MPNSRDRNKKALVGCGPSRLSVMGYSRTDVDPDRDKVGPPPGQTSPRCEPAAD